MDGVYTEVDVGIVICVPDHARNESRQFGEHSRRGSNRAINRTLFVCCLDSGRELVSGPLSRLLELVLKLNVTRNEYNSGSRRSFINRGVRHTKNN